MYVYIKGGNMKTIKKQIIAIIFIVILCFVANNCTVLMHDRTNPCSDAENADSLECNNWKVKYPKDYEKYLKRVKKTE